MAEETLKREIRKVLALVGEDSQQPSEELEEQILALLTEKGDKEYAAKRDDLRAALRACKSHSSNHKP